MSRILLCTVGGSPEPIVKAIAILRPDRVVFFCTGPDPATGKPGSQPEGAAIAVAAGLAAGAWREVLVPADDPDGAAQAMRVELAHCSPGNSVVADYTGGTKSMSAALLLAALERRGVELQIITGPRTSTDKIQAGAEHLKPISAARSLFVRELPAALAHWKRFDYGAAAQVLEAMGCPAAEDLQVEWQRARQLSHAFAAWDRFDHAAAYTTLQQYAPALGRALDPHLAKLCVLARDDGEKRAPARLLDLWRNAERCAARQRYDDAVARWYRLVEGFAQWQLRVRCGIETADVATEKIPANLTLTTGADGRRQAGLWNAWRLLAHHAPGSAPQKFFADQGDTLRGLLDSRNASILAHGYTPLGEAAWRRLAVFTTEHFWPLLQREAQDRAHLNPDFPQLPSSYAAFEAGDSAGGS